MMQVYKVVMCAVTGDFKLDVNITKIEKRELLSLENPHYNRVLDKNAHLRMMTRRISYPFMLISEQAILLRYTPENDCTSVAVVTVAEFTRFGWAIVSPGADQDISPGYLALQLGHLNFNLKYDWVLNCPIKYLIYVTWCVQLCLYTFIQRLAVLCLKFVLFRCLFDKRNVLINIPTS